MLSGQADENAAAQGAVGEARIQSIARAKALLDVMADGGWVSLRDLAVRTGLAKTTAFNLVKALVDTGLAERNVQAGAYRLSLQHLIYGRAVERRLDVSAVARPHLIAVCTSTRETVNLALPGPADAVIVDSLEGSHTLRVSSYSGTRAPYHSTACGRALLAWQTESFRKFIYGRSALTPSTRHTITDPEKLEEVLERCRRDGWTVEMEENELGSACIAAPIFGASGEAVAAVSIAGPAARFDPATITHYGEVLLTHLPRVTADLIGQTET
ncbi:IclR family transcriptional regulator [Microvirga puerhi]|uniref:IclR family transcriptional regulator n=1 Tax=Microvirga puerhi TaxID=2876078 RepID=A0ABS7VHB5_9HYPH|nr:IclR family transcriptional regulator [Microvirga puerhi]